MAASALAVPGVLWTVAMNAKGAGLGLLALFLVVCGGNDVDDQAKLQFEAAFQGRCDTASDLTRTPSAEDNEPPRSTTLNCVGRMRAISGV